MMQLVDFATPWSFSLVVTLLSILVTWFFLKGFISPTLTLLLWFLGLSSYSVNAYLQQEPELIYDAVNIPVEYEGCNLKEDLEKELARWSGINIRPRRKVNSEDFVLLIAVTGSPKSMLNEALKKQESYYEKSTLSISLDGQYCPGVSYTIPTFGKGKGYNDKTIKYHRNEQITQYIRDRIRKIGKQLRNCLIDQIEEN